MQNGSTMDHCCYRVVCVGRLCDAVLTSNPLKNRIHQTVPEIFRNSPNRIWVFPPDDVNSPNCTVLQVFGEFASRGGYSRVQYTVQGSYRSITKGKESDI